MVSDSTGSTNSANALLTVNPVPTCNPPPTGIVAWWPGNGNADDIVSGNNGTLFGNVTYVSGEVNQAFSFEEGSAYMRCPASTTLNVGAGGGLTIEGWINPTEISDQQPLVEWNNGSTYGAHFWISTGGPGEISPGCLWVNLVDTGGNLHYLASPAAVVHANVFQHVAATYNKSTGVVTLYCNGLYQLGGLHPSNDL
jgi:hypothetical protein